MLSFLRIPLIKNQIYIFFVFLVSFFITSCSDAKNVKPKAAEGFIDLSDYDFNLNGNVPLDGAWEFYPGKIITPEEFNSGKIYKPFYIDQPTNWKNKKFGSVNLDPYGTATYRLKVLLNKDHLEDSISHKTLGLKVIEIHSAYSLWINGVLFHQQGRVTTLKDNFKPLIKPYSGFFIQQNDTLTIVINVANFFDRKMAGVDDRVILGLEKDILQDTNFKSFFFLLASGILLIMGIYNFLLYFIRREERLHFYLGIMSFLFAVQALWVGEKSIFFVFPFLDYSLYQRIWMLTTNLFAVLIFFYNNLFPQEVSKKAAYISLGVVLAFSFISLVTPYSFHGIILDYIFYFGLMTFAYQLVVLIKAYRKKRKFAGISLIGFLIPITFGVNDILFGLDLIVTGYYSPIGLALFIVIQSFVVSSKFARSYERVIELSNDLQALNENLERAVEKRTEELKTANTELSILNKQKDRFFSIISHDLKNPFNTLIGMTEYLRSEKIKNSTELSEMYSTLHDSAIRGYNLLHNLLEWSSLQFASSKAQPVNTCICDISQETKEHFEKQLDIKELELIINIEKNTTVMCEPGVLRTIFRNLVGNAIKFSNPKNKIIVSAITEDHHVKLSVKDFGIGIPADKQECIFKIDDKYHREGTSGETGSGMGLIIIKELVERNNGQISFTSREGKGTEFMINFPAN